MKGFFFPFYKKENYKNNVMNNTEKKNLVSLLLVLVLTKSLNFLSSYMLIFKVHGIKIFSYVNENNNDVFERRKSGDLSGGDKFLAFTSTEKENKIENKKDNI